MSKIPIKYDGQIIWRLVLTRQIIHVDIGGLINDHLIRLYRATYIDECIFGCLFVLEHRTIKVKLYNIAILKDFLDRFSNRYYECLGRT